MLAPPVSTSLLGAFGPRFAGVESLTMGAIALFTGIMSARRDDFAGAEASRADG
jgi:hypothetical protein